MTIDGLNDDTFRGVAYTMIEDLCSAHKRGLVAEGTRVMLDLILLVNTAVLEDIRKDQNPALTEWRLGCFNDAIQAEANFHAGPFGARMGKFVIDRNCPEAPVGYQRQKRAVLRAQDADRFIRLEECASQQTS